MFLGSFGQLTFPLSDHGAFLFTQLPRRQVSLTKRFSLFYYSTGNRGKWDWWTGGDLGGRPSGRLFAGSSVSVISTCWPPTRASIEDSWVSSNEGTSFFFLCFCWGCHSPIKSKSSPPTPLNVVASLLLLFRVVKVETQCLVVSNRRSKVSLFIFCPPSRLASKAISHSDSYGNVRHARELCTRMERNKTRLKEKNAVEEKSIDLFGWFWRPWISCSTRGGPRQGGNLEEKIHQ